MYVILEPSQTTDKGRHHLTSVMLLLLCQCKSHLMMYRISVNCCELHIIIPLVVMDVVDGGGGDGDVMLL